LENSKKILLKHEKSDFCGIFDETKISKGGFVLEI
jgi:hypothetical protein